MEICGRHHYSFLCKYSIDSKCSPCVGGKHCNIAGLTSDDLALTDYDCPAGSYCNPSLTDGIQESFVEFNLKKKRLS